jgi:hypothetical protein
MADRALVYEAPKDSFLGGEWSVDAETDDVLPEPFEAAGQRGTLGWGETDHGRYHVPSTLHSNGPRVATLEANSFYESPVPVASFVKRQGRRERQGDAGAEPKRGRLVTVTIATLLAIAVAVVALALALASISRSNVSSSPSSSSGASAAQVGETTTTTTTTVAFNSSSPNTTLAQFTRDLQQNLSSIALRITSNGRVLDRQRAALGSVETQQMQMNATLASITRLLAHQDGDGDGDTTDAATSTLSYGRTTTGAVAAVSTPRSSSLAVPTATATTTACTFSGPFPNMQAYNVVDGTSAFGTLGAAQSACLQDRRCNAVVSCTHTNGFQMRQGGPVADQGQGCTAWGRICA